MYIKLISNIESLEKENLNELRKEIFNQSNGKSIFEKLMDTPESNHLYNLLLETTNETELNQTKYSNMKKQMLNYAYSTKRLEYIFLNESDLQPSVITKAKHLNRPNSNIKRSQKWLDTRMSGSTTVTTSSNSSTVAKHSWMKAEQRMRHLAEDLNKNPRPIKWSEIAEIHVLLTSGEEDVPNPGALRKGIARTSGGWTHLYSMPELLPSQVEYFISWLNEGLEKVEKGSKDPVLLSAEVYQRFVSLHPFENGNGRISRLLMDLTLEINNIPPPAIDEPVLDAVFPLEHKRIDQENYFNKILNGIENSFIMLTIS